MPNGNQYTAFVTHTTIRTNSYFITHGNHTIMVYNLSELNGTDYYYMPVEESESIGVTDLRKDADYTIYYNNWTRFIFIGVLPVWLLIFFNYKVGAVQLKVRNPCVTQYVAGT